MKKQFTWVTVVALIVIVVSGIFFGIQEKPQVSKALGEKTEKKVTAVKKSDKKETVQQENVSAEPSKTEASATESATKESTSKESATNDSTSAPTKTVETVVPSNVDVDAINDYNSADATWDGNNIVVQVVATGDVHALANFAKPYADFIKEMNEGVSDVIVHIYSSNDALSKGQLFAEFKNGSLTQL